MVSDSSITSQDVQDGTLTGADVQDGSLGRADVGESIIALGTLQTTTNGTFKDFTGIPSWARRVTLMFNQVSSAGAVDMLLQLGVGTTPMTSGYQSASSTLCWSSGVVTTTSSAGIPIYNNAASYFFTGVLTLHKLDDSANNWIANGSFNSPVTTLGSVVSGGLAPLSGALGMVRLTTTSGTPAFDNGSVNISWQ